MIIRRSIKLAVLAVTAVALLIPSSSRGDCGPVIKSIDARAAHGGGVWIIAEIRGANSVRIKGYPVSCPGFRRLS